MIVPFPALLSTLIRRRFQVKPATLLIPIDNFLFLLVEGTNSDILRRVVQADFNLQPRSSACWTAQLLSAFQGLRGCELYVLAV